MSTIPASQFSKVTPSVLSAGGSPLAFNGLLITTSIRVPIGVILSFPSQATVAAYFGALSEEAIIATSYFLGFDNSNIKPNAILITRYPQTAQSAWVRSGVVSAITIPQLQALSGTLIVPVDGATVTSGTINLSTATSFSAAATLMQTGLNAFDGVTSSATTVAAGTATNSTAASITGNVLTVAATVTGTFVVGGVLTGTGVTAGTTILNQISGTTGGAGTYTVSVVQNVATTTITQTYAVMTVGAMTSGYLAPGQVVSGGTLAAGTTIVSQLTGSPIGGAGTYVLSGGAQTQSATIVSAGALTVTYDSVQGAFVITGGTPGTLGTIGYVTGTLSTALMFTAATGATLSQGAAATDPIAFMNSVVNISQNWVSFMTDYNPDAYGNAVRQQFASWANSTIDRYAYLAWDPDVTVLASNNATSSLANIIKTLNYDGTVVITSPDYNIAAFVMGAIASVDFTQHNGITNQCFRAQSGQIPFVTDQTSYNNMIANGASSYISVATANQGFNFFANGAISGKFQWLDAYTNEIWLNNAFQLAFMTLLTSTLSLPNNETGRSLIRAAAMDPIKQALNFGMFGPSDPLSALQTAEVNNAAGINIAGIIATQGWYLQILPSTAQNRALRVSPPMTFWYHYNQSINQLNLASIEVA
jgi:hypothetical protein